MNSPKFKFGDILVHSKMSNDNEFRLKIKYLDNAGFYHCHDINYNVISPETRIWPKELLEEKYVIDFKYYFYKDLEEALK